MTNPAPAPADPGPAPRAFGAVTARAALGCAWVEIPPGDSFARDAAAAAGFPAAPVRDGFGRLCGYRAGPVTPSRARAFVAHCE